MLTHRNGQVEIDALFVGRRAGRQCLFILEAKVGPCQGSLAKHKLLYACVPLRARAPADMPVVPVYLKISPTAHGLLFNCAVFHVAEAGAVPLNQLELSAVRRLAVPEQLFGLVG